MNFYLVPRHVYVSYTMCTTCLWNSIALSPDARRLSPMQYSSIGTRRSPPPPPRQFRSVLRALRRGPRAPFADCAICSGLPSAGPHCGRRSCALVCPFASIGFSPDQSRGEMKPQLASGSRCGAGEGKKRCAPASTRGQHET